MHEARCPRGVRSLVRSEFRLSNDDANTFIYACYSRVCWTHGAKASAKRCSDEECKSVAVKDGACWKHGAKDLAMEAYSSNDAEAQAAVKVEGPVALCMPTSSNLLAAQMAASIDATEDLGMISSSESAGSSYVEAYTQYMAEDLQYLEDLPELPVMEI